MDASKLDAQPICIFKRQDGIQYFVEHNHDWLYVVTNAQNAFNYQILRIPTSVILNTVMENENSIHDLENHWQVVIPHNTKQRIDDIDMFEQYLIIYSRGYDGPSIDVISFEYLGSCMNSKNYTRSISSPGIPQKQERIRTSISSSAAAAVGATNTDDVSSSSSEGATTDEEHHISSSLSSDRATTDNKHHILSSRATLDTNHVSNEFIHERGLNKVSVPKITIPIPHDAVEVEPGGNLDFHSTRVRFGISSATAPLTMYDFDLTTLSNKTFSDTFQLSSSMPTLENKTSQRRKDIPVSNVDQAGKQFNAMYDEKNSFQTDEMNVFPDQKHTFPHTSYQTMNDQNEISLKEKTSQTIRSSRTNKQSKEMKRDTKNQQTKFKKNKGLESNHVKPIMEVDHMDGLRQLDQPQIGVSPGWPLFRPQHLISYKLWVPSRKQHTVESLYYDAQSSITRCINGTKNTTNSDMSTDMREYVPITIVHRRDIEMDGRAPLLLKVYGAYGDNLDASFETSHLPLLNRGWVLAFSHVRGGGELGSTWYHDGRLLSKTNSIGDFVASIQGVCNFGLTSPQFLSIKGESAGGFIAGWTLQNYPHLIRTGILNVPFLDVMRAMSDPSLPLTVPEYSEWGDPVADIPSGTHHILSQLCPYSIAPSPGKTSIFQRHKNAILNSNEETLNSMQSTMASLPSLLLTGAVEDPRVPVYHPLKFLAKTRHITKNDFISSEYTSMSRNTSSSNERSMSRNTSMPNDHTSSLYNTFTKKINDVLYKNPRAKQSLSPRVWTPELDTIGSIYNVYAPNVSTMAPALNWLSDTSNKMFTNIMKRNNSTNLTCDSSSKIEMDALKNHYLDYVLDPISDLGYPPANLYNKNTSNSLEKPIHCVRIASEGAGHFGGGGHDARMDAIGTEMTFLHKTLELPPQ